MSLDEAAAASFLTMVVTVGNAVSTLGVVSGTEGATAALSGETAAGIEEEVEWRAVELSAGVACLRFTQSL